MIGSSVYGECVPSTIEDPIPFHNAYYVFGMSNLVQIEFVKSSFK